MGLLLLLFKLPQTSQISAAAIGSISGITLRVVDLVITPFVSIKKYYFSVTRLNHELKELKNDHQAILKENIALKASFHFMQKIKEIKEFCQRYELHNALICKILVKNFGPEGQFFLINRGSRDEVVLNMIAAYKFQLLGKVVEVYPTYSKILLITDPSSKVTAHTNIGGHKGIVFGSLNYQESFMHYIDQHLKVAENDLVFSSGQGMVFPEGFCLGTIVGIEKKEIYQVAQIKPIIDLATIEFCQLTNQEKIEAF